jgi:hypothetical protein
VLGLHVSKRVVAFRFVLALALAILTFVFLIYIPANLPAIASGTFRVTESPFGSEVLRTLVAPTQPTLGLFIVMLVFAGVFFRGTKVYGPILIQNGLAFMLYVYSIFQGGVVHLEVFGSAFGASEAELELSLSVSPLMLLFLIPAALTIMKGILVTRDSIRGRTSGMPTA